MIFIRLIAFVLAGAPFSVFALNSFNGDFLFPGLPNAQYSASMMVDQFDSGREKIWYCQYLDASNPADPVAPRLAPNESDRDVIRYAHRSGGAWSSPVTVQFFSFDRTASPAALLPSDPSDSRYMCDPSVIRGYWNIPSLDPFSTAPFGYALYYTTSSPRGARFGSPTSNCVENGGFDARIRVAFSRDGVNFYRYPDPVVVSALPAGCNAPGDSFVYGAGQQVAFSADAGAGVHLVYTDVIPGSNPEYWYKYSPNGVDFLPAQKITTNGLPAWGTSAGQRTPLNPAIAFAPGGVNCGSE